MKEAAESSKKRKRTGKSLVPPPSSPVLLDSETETIFASSPTANSPQSTKINKNLAKYLALGKEKYFGSKKVLRGRTFHPEIRTMEGRVTPRDRKVLKREMSPFHKLMFELVHKGILPRGERRHEASFRDIGIAHALENKDPIDWPSLMIKQMARVIDRKPGVH
ncbi:hypothetical protein H5410_027171 [Solanum commersonii]|uniref:Uncharacterized protein n=1 Tax=Solanum commersonii TaxID=4109 RepID=A0A9J5Z178_SOLCO|nr:hypothetical protein H5410_027171 [Solanum commersonii]